MNLDAYAMRKRNDSTSRETTFSDMRERTLIGLKKPKQKIPDKDYDVIKVNHMGRR